jgi:hypothetical protein
MNNKRKKISKKKKNKKKQKNNRNQKTLEYKETFFVGKRGILTKLLPQTWYLMVKC